MPAICLSSPPLAHTCSRPVAPAPLGCCRWPTSARLPPQGRPALLQLGRHGEKNASIWLKGGLLTRSPSQPLASAERGSALHTQAGTATRSWVALILAHIQEAAAPANPKLKEAHAVHQLTAFIRQNGKSCCCCSCSGEALFKQGSWSPPSGSLLTIPSLCRGLVLWTGGSDSGSILGCNWPLVSSLPAFSARPGHSCAFGKS